MNAGPTSLRVVSVTCQSRAIQWRRGRGFSAVLFLQKVATFNSISETSLAICGEAGTQPVTPRTVRKSSDLDAVVRYPRRARYQVMIGQISP